MLFNQRLSYSIVFFGLCFYASGQEFPPTPGMTFVKVPKPVNQCSLKNLYAKCDMVANPNKPSDINGTIYFKQEVDEFNCRHAFMNIQVVIYNVPSNDGIAAHGLHIHEYGDMSGGCESMGGHYNPYNRTHGRQWGAQDSKHLGDLGNVYQRPNGDINMRIVEYLADLSGINTILGRGLVLHALEDDLGMNFTSPNSKINGNAGARLACCVIGYSSKHDDGVFTLYK